MRLWNVRRIVFGLLLLQEGIIWARSTPEERRQAPPVKRPALFGGLLLLPFFLRLPRPAWLERLGLAMQISGWLLELAAMGQLIRSRSFGVHPTAATTGVQTGLYRLEHPIYLGILLSQAGWTLPCPPSWLGVVMMFRTLRRAIVAERAHLSALNIRHRGLDSALWGAAPDSDP